MATAMQMLKESLSALTQGDVRGAWRSLNDVPDCPQCKGSGAPVNGFTEIVYWQGQQVEVCATCEGRGKV